MKRLTALAVWLLLPALLCACAKQAAAALKIVDTDISAGVYAYVLDQVMQEQTDADTRKTLLAQTEERCAAYAALDAWMQEEDLTLSVALKSEAADRVRGLWQFFSGHYQTLGIRKSDLTQLMTWEAKKKALTAHIFGEGGEQEVSEEKLKQWFRQDYVGYRGFSESLTKENAAGDTVPLSDAEEAVLQNTFAELQKRAASGASIDSLYKEYCKEKGLLATADADVTLLKTGDPTATEAFFKTVLDLKTNETAVLKNGSRLYLLQKIDLTAADAPYFAQLRDDVLLSKKLPVIETELRDRAAAFTATEHTQLCNEIYARVRASLSEQS